MFCFVSRVVAYGTDRSATASPPHEAVVSDHLASWFRYLTARKKNTNMKTNRQLHRTELDFFWTLEP